MKQCLVATPILALPDALQEEIIHWVFRNEDRYANCSGIMLLLLLLLLFRVWRYRGGRSGHETLHQFMNFLGRQAPVQHPAVSSSSSFSPLPLAPPSNVQGSGTSLNQGGGEAYAGVAVFADPQLVALEGEQWDPNSVQVTVL